MARGQRRNNLAFLHRDRGYRFEDRDGDLEFITGAISASGLTTKEIAQNVGKLTHGVYQPSPTTLDNWQNGKTRKPQNFGMTWVAYSMGYERTWTQTNVPQLTLQQIVEQEAAEAQTEAAAAG